jgi:hypothetical protein
MKVTRWVKRRQSDVQAVTQVKRLSLVTYPGGDRVENLEGYAIDQATDRLSLQSVSHP